MVAEQRIYSSIDDHAFADPQTHGDALNTEAIILPKYYPEEHELTKWMINQMRRRNSLHHLVNFANAHPFILSSYFEVFDQPEKYINEEGVPKIPAYSNKTVLFLTPLAMAIYFGCKSVVKVLLNDEVSKLQERARQHVDVNATCFARRIKPKIGIFGIEDYFTTTPAILSIRRVFYPGLALLINAGFQPQNRVSYIDHVASHDQKIYKSTDLIDYALRLMISRPVFDIVGLLHTLMHPGQSGPRPLDVFAYDVYVCKSNLRQKPSWFSLFRRVCRRGINPAYINCANRLIMVLEVLQTIGFFKLDVMPHGPIEYDFMADRSPAKRGQQHQRMSVNSIRALETASAHEAVQAMVIDRDECFAFLLIWLHRMKTRCLAKPSQRLTKILLSALADTEMLAEFLVPPLDVDIREVVWPRWIEFGNRLNQQIPNTHWKSCQEEINFVSEDIGISYVLEPQQVNDLRVQLRRIALMKRYIDQDALNRVPRTVVPQPPDVKTMPIASPQSKASIAPKPRTVQTKLPQESGFISDNTEWPNVVTNNRASFVITNPVVAPPSNNSPIGSDPTQSTKIATDELDNEEIVDQSNFNNSRFANSLTRKTPVTQATIVKPRPKTAKTRSPAPKPVPKRTKKRRPKTANVEKLGPPARWRI